LDSSISIVWGGIEGFKSFKYKIRLKLKVPNLN